MNEPKLTWGQPPPAVQPSKARHFFIRMIYSDCTPLLDSHFRQVWQAVGIEPKGIESKGVESKNEHDVLHADRKPARALAASR